MKESIPLSTLMLRLKEHVERLCPTPVWIRAEIATMTLHPNGHCYLELVEQNELRQPLAKARATIWSSTYRHIAGKFERETGAKLAQGMKVLIAVEPRLHPVYSFSLNIVGIDPEYTMGRFILEREETIAQLAKEGILELNKRLRIPSLPKRIAVVSAQNAAGYQDFMRHIEPTARRYGLSINLFTATLQGEKAVESITDALQRAWQSEQPHDLLILIRGGGSQLDLTCFNSLPIAAAVARFPIPVITGIGHERDFSASDAAAHTHCKTPTAVAQMVIDLFAQTEQRLQQIINQLSQTSRMCLTQKQHQQARTESQLRLSFERFVSTQQKREQNLTASIRNQANLVIKGIQEQLRSQSEAITHQAQELIQRKMHDLQLTHQQIAQRIDTQLKEKMWALQKQEALIAAANPHKILSQGFAMVSASGQRILRAEQAKLQEQLTITFIDGEITAKPNP